MDEQISKNIIKTTIEATIIKADGTRIPLGIISESSNEEIDLTENVKSIGGDE